MEYREETVKNNTENNTENNKENLKNKEKNIRYKISNKVLIYHFFLMGLGVGFYTFPKQILLNKHNYLEVNNRYLTGCTGVFNKTVQNSPISQITAVRVNQGILGRWLNYGDILITTANGQYHYTAMESPELIQKHILSLI